MPFRRGAIKGHSTVAHPIARPIRAVLPASVHDFAGVTLDDLHKVESKFKTNVVVYQLVEIDNGKTMAELVRRSPAQYQETMYANLHESHYSYIQDIGKYCHSYRCRKCGDSLWKCPYDLHRHELTCEVGVNRKYKGGVYHPPPSVFERLDDEGIVVEKTLRYYPYRATFDFECYFTRDNLPADTDHVQWVARHVPLSESVASNVPGHEDAQCYITNGDSNKLVEEMVNNSITKSDAAYDSLKPSYGSVLNELEARKEAWDDAESEANAEEEWDSAEEECRLEEAENEDEVAGKNRTNPFKKLLYQLFRWLHKLPVIGFNSGKYDLNMIKRSFVPLLISNNAAVIKRQNTYMCLYTDKLKFVDICNYLAPGYSYDKYLKAYGCELQKGHFPYEYMDGIGKLEDRALPPQAAFYSQLKSEEISDADYARCQAVWHDNQMTTDPPPRQRWNMTQQQIITAVVDGTLFGMVECDVRVPSELRAHFAEMQPIFKNTTVTRDDIGSFMRQYAEEHDIMSTPRRMLVGSYHGEKILLASPLLRWYLAHGLVVDRVYQIVEYSPKPCFQHFGDSVSTARRNGDVDPDKSIIADTMKLLGNSAYGKTVTNVDRHRNVTYSTEVGTSALISNKWFRQLDVVTADAYEVTSNKARVTYDLPHHIGFFVYQYAKLRMLEFYYDFVDR